METRRLVRTWYRSWTPDGRIWCETSSWDELLQQSHPSQPLTYERLDIYEINSGWRSFTMGRGA